MRKIEGCDSVEKGQIIAGCLGIEHGTFLDSLYQGMSIIDLYATDGSANRASEVSHYCTISTLESILREGCLRFTDVRFLNDSTEFIHILGIVESVIKETRYTNEFRDFILHSKEMKILEKYKQPYWMVLREKQKYKEILYRTYTCSLSAECNLLNMWNYYASTSTGVSIVFDFAWNMFEGSSETKVNTWNQLENGIIIYRGSVVYDEEKKKYCVRELLDQLSSLYEGAKENLDEYAIWLLNSFKTSINHMRCFFKPSVFKDEKEYRIALMVPEELILEKMNSNEENNTKLKQIKKCGVFVRESNLIPYIDYKFNMNSIQKVIVNPYKGKDSMLELGIKEYLWMKKLERVKVIPSGIPVRKYS